ncbi:MAG: alpha/beta hydrolase [Pseudomonadota bacterium]|nr:alpha/beta hydrolase [Pseudomonadota bacterium]
MTENTKDISKRVHNIPHELAIELRNIGKVFNPSVVDKTLGLYIPTLSQIDRTGIKIIRDISYGPDSRNILDIHHDGSEAKDLPVVIFFHGGGFVRGHKNIENDLLYGNVANFCVRNGMIGVNATYRLAPEAKWPEGAVDVGRAVDWARENISSYGGDPTKIFLLGQSAGATHVSTYVLRKSMHPDDNGPGCAGAILMSGVYGISAKNTAPNIMDYYGEASEKYDEMGVLGNVDHGDTPVMIVTSEYDIIGFEKVAIALMNEIAAKFNWLPRYKQMSGHNHVSQVYSIGSGDNGLEPDIIDFVDRIVNPY